MTGDSVRGELVQFASADGLMLSGILYEPRKASRAGVIWLHGNGDASVFTSARTPLLAAALNRRNIAFLPFDNRGSHMFKRFRRRSGRERRRVEIGMARELIADAVHDIRGALRFMRQRGYTDIHLAGHSTGANKICVYETLTRRSGARSNLLIAGGDDVGLYRESLGRTRFDRVLERSRREVASGRGDRLIPAGISYFPMSWSSLLDTIDPDGLYNTFPFREALTGERLSAEPLFRMVTSLRRPSVAIYGSEDEYCFGNVNGCVRLLEQHAPARTRFETRVIEGADHGFTGRSDGLARSIADWIAGL